MRGLSTALKVPTAPTDGFAVAITSISAAQVGDAAAIASSPSNNRRRYNI